MTIRAKSVTCKEEHGRRFQLLSDLLLHFDVLWRESAFYQADLEWQQHYPELSQALLQLSDEQLCALEKCPEQLHAFLRLFLPQYDQLLSCLAIEELPSRELLFPAHLNVGVSGRKWLQAQTFIATLPEVDASERRQVVDWCAGKSHLGRALAWHWQSDLHAIERQAPLCGDGEHLARPWVNAVRFSCKDVLEQPHHFNAGECVVALHACGDLHRTLARQWLQSPSQQLFIVPCCYHLWLSEHYSPLSQAAQQAGFTLSKQQVRLSVQEMVSSSARERSQARTMATWRLAFDFMQRDLRGEDTYLSAPSVPYSLLALGAEAVLKHLACSRSLPWPEAFDSQPYLRKAEARYAQYRRLQLASHGFRRALELWLVLDIVLFLQEGGAKVALNVMCPRSLTPRNLRIWAHQ